MYVVCNYFAAVRAVMARVFLTGPRSFRVYCFSGTQTPQLARFCILNLWWNLNFKLCVHFPNSQ